MEFWIAFFVTFIIGSIYSYGKRAYKKEKRETFAATTKVKKEPRSKLQQADEELITVILPTIDHDK